MSQSINVAAGLKKLCLSYLGIWVIFPCTDDLSLQSPISHADDAWVSFGRRDGIGLDWVQLPCEEAQLACRRGDSGGHLLFCWGHYGRPLSRCWSIFTAHRCSSTPADKCHLSMVSKQVTTVGLLQGQVDNSDVYSQTAPQYLVPAGMVMPSGNK